MGKKRKRAKLADGEQIEIDPLYFDNPVGISLELQEPVDPRPEPEDADLHHKKPSTSELNDSAIRREASEPFRTNPDDSHSPNDSSAAQPVAITDAGIEQGVVSESVSESEEVIEIPSTSSEAEVIEIISSSPVAVSQPAPAASDTSDDEVQYISSSPTSPAQTESFIAKPPVEIRIKSRIPGKEGTRTVEWGPNVPFYGLEKDFGRESVFVHANNQFKKYQTPAKLEPEASVIEIEILTAIQWKAVQLGESLSEEEEETNKKDEIDILHSETNEESIERFPITLDGREGEVRVLVSHASKVADLVNHYMAVKNVSSDKQVRVNFDGDTVSLSDTLESLDIEEDDKIDLHFK